MNALTGLRGTAPLIAAIALHLLPAPVWALPQVMRIIAARLDAAASSTAPGAVHVSGVLRDTDASGALDDALLGGALLLSVHDAREFNVNVPLSGCHRVRETLLCATARGRVMFKQTGA